MAEAGRAGCWRCDGGADACARPPRRRSRGLGDPAACDLSALDPARHPNHRRDSAKRRSRVEVDRGRRQADRSAQPVCALLARRRACPSGCVHGRAGRGDPRRRRPLQGGKRQPRAQRGRRRPRRCGCSSARRARIDGVGLPLWRRGVRRPAPRRQRCGGRGDRRGAPRGGAVPADRRRRRDHVLRCCRVRVPAAV